MKPRLDTWTLVIAGGWNSRIFRPEWVAKQFFDEKSLEIELMVAPGPSAIRYLSATDSLALIVSDERLVVGIRKASSETMSAAETLARRALGLLPHTPVSAVGVNFGFVEENPDAILSHLFELPDEVALSEHHLLSPRISVARAITLETATLNLSHTFANGIVETHLNFHKDENSTDKAEQFLAGKCEEYLRIGKNLLHNVYQCDLEGVNV